MRRNGALRRHPRRGKVAPVRHKAATRGLALAGAALLAWPAWAQVQGSAGAAAASPARLAVETEVERLVAGGEEDGGQVRLLPLESAPAAGEELIYTVSFVNLGPVAATDVRITQPIPAEVRLVAGSAAAPRAELLYSIDGGRSFGWPEELSVDDGNGGQRRADADAYTHVRWRLDGPIEPGSRGFVRFRAVAR